MPALSNLSAETRIILENLANINQEAFWIWDLETDEICRFGEAFYRNFGINLTGCAAPANWHDLIHPEDAGRLNRIYKKTISDASISTTEETYQVRKTNGSYCYVIDRAAIDRKEDGTARRIYGLITDITLHQQQDIAREMLLSQLTKTNADLKQFSYIIGHNLRTPLANLIGLGTLLDEAKISDPFTRKTLQKYKEATLQLNKNLNDLFELLVQHTNPENQVKPLELDEVLKQVMDSVETNIAACGAEIKTNFSAGKTVRFNAAYLHSIFLNLLTNALKYRNPARKLEIDISTEKNGAGLLLHFADNGLGIDLNKYGDKVFGLYQKFHNHPDSKGLGLHLVATQVADMGGKVWVNSKPGQGATFTIQFKA